MIIIGIQVYYQQFTQYLQLCSYVHINYYTRTSVVLKYTETVKYLN